MTEVMKIERIEPMPPQAVTPMDMIDRAISSGANVETLEKASGPARAVGGEPRAQGLRPRHCGGEGEAPAIVKNQTANRGNAGSYRYEDLAQIAAQIDPVLSEFGLSYRFRTETDGAKIKVFLHRLAPRRLQRNDHVGKRRGHLWGEEPDPGDGVCRHHLQRYTLKGRSGAGRRAGRRQQRQAEAQGRAYVAGGLHHPARTHRRPRRGRRSGGGLPRTKKFGVDAPHDLTRDQQQAALSMIRKREQSKAVA